MKYKTLEIINEESISIVYLNRPKSLNSLNNQMLKELTDFSHNLNQNLETRAVVFTGKGENFSSGVDLKQKVNHSSNLQTWRSNYGKPAIESILDINQITIAAINGYCLGGAACIASACDFRIGSISSKVGYPEINLGINLNWLGLPLAVRLIGPAKAKRLVIGGKHESSENLLKWGFYDKITESESLLQEAREMASFYATKPPIAAQMIKRSINQLVYSLDKATMHMDYDQTLLTTKTNDRSEAIKAFFEKREPKFRGD